jgi:triacylglycerol lipase
MGTALRWLGAVLGCAALAACHDPVPSSTTGAAADFPKEPALEIAQAQLDMALDCTPRSHNDKPSVLLIPGGFTSGFEPYDWIWLPLLAQRGYDVCVLLPPDRGFGDMQVSAEYVVNAVRRMHARSGRKVAVIGHSEGVNLARWALKWWPSARASVDDLVMLAGSNHGGDPAALVPYYEASPGMRAAGGVAPAMFYQFGPGSSFTKALNAGNEAPDGVSYTSIYSDFYDGLVQPILPVPTPALDWDRSRSNISNVLLQTVCPGRGVDHIGIANANPVAFALALDAIDHSGPASVQRAGGGSLCAQPDMDPAQIEAQAPPAAAELIERLKHQPDPAPDAHLTKQEPALRAYAQRKA